MNILLVTVDTLTARHLECYGYRQATSPILAELAEQGVLFEDFFAPTVPTTPSFTSMFTGVDAYGHQVVNVMGEHDLSPEFKTMAQILKEGGYYTASIDNVQKHWFAWGFNRQESPGPIGGDPKSRTKRYMEQVNELALPLLDDLKEKSKWFLWVHPWDPHTPYWPPPPWNTRFYEGKDECDRTNLSLKEVYAFDGFERNYRYWLDPEWTDAKYVVAQYDGEIGYMSEHLSRLFDRMQALGLWEDTLVIVTSDHGEILDDHPGQFDHHGLYENNLHVPLIVRFPGNEYAGRRVKAMTANVDILPTVLEFADIPIPAAVEGRSLMPLVRGERSEQYDQLFLGEATWQCKRGVRTKEWKFIRALSTSVEHNWHGEGQRELYSICKDPLERANVVNVRPKVARELERRLDEWLLLMQERYGHADPIERQGISLGREAIKFAIERDVKTGPIR